MGLDITAYKKIKLIRIEDADTWEEGWPYSPDNFHIWPDYVNKPDFPEQIEGADIEAGGVYEYAEKFGFPAGSYSGYNRWRELLSVLMLGVTPSAVWRTRVQYSDRPFFYLINFSDSEGLIAGPAAERLARDFAAYQDKANAGLEPWALERYNNFRKAFEFAADGGLVEFH